MSMSAALAQRKALRQHALQARQALSADEHRALSAALIVHLDVLVATLAPTRLALCWPYRKEVDLRAWAAAWLAAAPQRVLALPVVVEKHAAMQFHQWTPDAEMATDRYGIPYPANAVEIAPEVVLVPLNAFDAAGYRLGYGGGYFDRTLAGLPAIAIGVGFELGRVPSALPQAHDRPMDWIVTERGFQPAAGEPRKS